MNDHILVQDSLNCLCDWARDNQLTLSIPKCFVLHLGHSNPKISYFLNNIELSSDLACKDLGINMSCNLRFNEHINLMVKKAYNIINIIFRGFSIKDKNILVKAYKSYVLPILEYGSNVWSPQYLYLIDLIERVQRYFSRRLFKRLGLADTNYINRLLYLSLDALELRRIRSDLIMCFKIVHNFVDLLVSDFFEFSLVQTRGNSLKMYKKFCKCNIVKHSFANRVVAYWNFLPDYVENLSLIKANNVLSFKNLLLNIDLSRFLKFDRTM